MRCEFATEIAGEYRVTAVVTDDAGRPNRTETTTWVAGDGSAPVRRLEQQQVTIVPDRETYAVGDTAELLVQVPFDATSGLATVSHADIVSSETFAIEGGSAVIEIPIDEASVPGLTVQVDVVGTAARTADDGTPLPDAPPRPAFATGQIALDVPPLTRALTVTASPAAGAARPRHRHVGHRDGRRPRRSARGERRGRARRGRRGGARAHRLRAHRPARHLLRSAVPDAQQPVHPLQRAAHPRRPARRAAATTRATRPTPKSPREPRTRPAATGRGPHRLGQRALRTHHRSRSATTSTRSPCSHPVSGPVPTGRSPSPSRCPTRSPVTA
jgi:hypothetical protein